MNRVTPIFPLSSLLAHLSLPNSSLPFLTTFVFSTVRAYTIILIPLSPIGNTDIPDLISNLHPFLTAGRNRGNLAQGPVCQACDYETGEEVDVVDVLGTHGHRFPNGTNKSDNVDKDTANIRCISAPVEAESEVVRCRFAGRVEVLYLVVSAADDVVIAYDNACNGREEDRISG